MKFACSSQITPPAGSPPAFLGGCGYKDRHRAIWSASLRCAVRLAYSTTPVRMPVRLPIRKILADVGRATRPAVGKVLRQEGGGYCFAMPPDYLNPADPLPDLRNPTEAHRGATSPGQDREAGRWGCCFCYCSAKPPIVLGVPPPVRPLHAPVQGTWRRSQGGMALKQPTRLYPR